jgi:hypothetical protein
MTHLLYCLLIAASSFSKAEVFKAISGKDASSLTKMISKLEDLYSSSDQQAYLGTLKMKRAEQLKTAKEKLAMFKEEEDAKLVSSGYQSLASDVRNAVVSYAKQSPNLSL